ncbi:MFS transporter [Pseudonocardia kujensis]|uniref:MFS transporter n=1 Tax=Pseudonocardia kujensis TaxID=1128675 RepID=UPI001E6350D8|nr:MFS transporter [Pseudonocardia kujensis]MCE0762099.1 MFS transporter [Pseudonocardia kujensis]
MSFSTPPAPPQGHPEPAEDPAPAAALEEVKAPRAISRRVVVASTLGTVTEYYELTVYAYLTTVIAVVFFPAADPTAALLAALAVFAATFIVRPLGGILFGWIGDRFGRRKALVLALLGMALATFAMGVLPSYAAFGIGATVLLVIARIAQGLSAGGEIGGAAAYLAEQAPVHRRGFYTSLVNFGVLCGTVSASLAVVLLNAMLSKEQMLSWGWRLPFLIALPLGLVGIYIRRKLEDSPQFIAAREEGAVVKVPVLELLKNHRKALLYGFVISSLTYGAFYVIFSYTQIYLVQVAKLSSTIASLSPTVGLLVALILQPTFGFLGDRLGRKRLLLLAIVCLVVLPFPMFLLLNSGAPALVFLANALLGIPVTLVQAVNLAALCELFPTTVRYSGVALVFNVAAIVFGGTTPLLCTWLIEATGNPVAPAFYLIALAVVCLPFLVTLPETARRPMRLR